MKHKRDFKALEKRRLKGAKLLARGVSKSEVARQLGVTRQTVAAWEQRLDEGGQDSLKRGALGRPRQLDAERERIAVVAGCSKDGRHCVQGTPAELSKWANE